MLDVACVDEGTGNMEEVVEPWIAGIWDVVAEAFIDDASAAAEQRVEEETGHLRTKSGNGCATVNSPSLPKTPPLNDSSLLNGGAPFSAPLLELELPTGLRPLTEFLSLSKYSSISDPGYIAPSGSVPRLRSTMHLSLSLPSPPSSSGPVGPESKCVICFRQLILFHLVVLNFSPLISKAAAFDTTGYPLIPRTRSISNDETSSTSNPHFRQCFNAELLKWRYLTKGGREAHRRVLHIEVSLRGSGIVYGPGDSFGVYGPNREEAVDYAISLLEPTLPEEASADTQLTV